MKRRELYSSLLHCVFDSVSSSSSRSLVFESMFTNMDKLTIPTVCLVRRYGVKCVSHLEKCVIYAHFIHIYSSHDHCKGTVCVDGNVWVLASNIKCLLISDVFLQWEYHPFLCMHLVSWQTKETSKGTSGGLLNTYTPSHT